jgi:hypothetical protein
MNRFTDIFTGHRNTLHGIGIMVLPFTSQNNTNPEFTSSRYYGFTRLSSVQTVIGQSRKQRHGVLLITCRTRLGHVAKQLFDPGLQSLFIGFLHDDALFSVISLDYPSITSDWTYTLPSPLLNVDIWRLLHTQRSAMINLTFS